MKATSPIIHVPLAHPRVPLSSPTRRHIAFPRPSHFLLFSLLISTPFFAPEGDRLNILGMGFLHVVWHSFQAWWQKGTFSDGVIIANQLITVYVRVQKMNYPVRFILFSPHSPPPTGYKSQLHTPKDANPVSLATRGVDFLGIHV